MLKVLKVEYPFYCELLNSIFKKHDFVMKYRVLIFVLLVPLFATAQTFDWWKNLVHWDGTTYWWKYLTMSPKYFGPNAIPVPAINN